jgi:sensor domain CHASE-containing protein
MNKNIFVKSYRFSLILGIGLSIGSLILYQILSHRNNYKIQRLINTDVARIRQEIISNLDTQVLKLVEASKEWELEGTNIPLDFNQTDFIENFQGYDLIQLVNQDLVIITNLVNDENQDLVLLNKEIKLNANHIYWFREAEKKEYPVLVSGVDLDVKNKEDFFSIYIPLIKENQFKGIVWAVFNSKMFFEKQKELYLEKGYLISILNNNYNEEITKNSSLIFNQKLIIDIYNLRWWLEIQPTSELIAQYKSGLPLIILVISLSLSWGIAAILIILKFKENQKQTNAIFAGVDGYFNFLDILDSQEDESITNEVINLNQEGDNLIINEETLLPSRGFPYRNYGKYRR